MKDIFFTGEGNGLSCFPCTSGSPDAVNIIFRILRQIKINDVANVFDMDTPGRHVSSDEDFRVPIFESFHQFQAFALGKVACYPFSRPIIALEPMSQVFDAGFSI